MGLCCFVIIFIPIMAPPVLTLDLIFFISVQYIPMINRNNIFCLLLQKNNQSVSRIDCGFLFLWLHLAVDVLFSGSA